MNRRRRSTNSSRSLLFSLFSFLLSFSLSPSAVDIRASPRDKLNHASTRLPATCTRDTRSLVRSCTRVCVCARARVCNGHGGKINCCPRAFNHELDLFISTSPTKSSRVYPRIFSITRPLRRRTPGPAGLMKNHLLPKETCCREHLIRLSN